MTTQQIEQIVEQKAKPSYSIVLYEGPTIIKKQTKVQAKQTLKNFWDDVGHLYSLGLRIKEEEAAVAKFLDRKLVVDVLAAILRTYETYFEPATPEQRKKYKDHLIKQGKHVGYKKVDHRTTEFHLLSRMVRHSATKQASADALVLIKARKAGQTSYTFVDWVKRNGGLNKIRTSNELAGDEVIDESKKTTPGKDKKIPAPFKKWRRLSYLDEATAPEALKALPYGVSHQVTIVRHANRIDIMVYEEATKTLVSNPVAQPVPIQSSIG